MLLCEGGDMKINNFTNMEATQLRKGNFIKAFINTVEGKLWRIVQVQCLHMNTVEFVGGETSAYNMTAPLELNDNNLKELGFEMYIHHFYSIRYKRDKVDGFYLNTEGELTKSMSEFMVRLYSVSDLQNWWRFTTGEELQVRPSAAFT